MSSHEHRTFGTVFQQEGEQQPSRRERSSAFTEGAGSTPEDGTSALDLAGLALSGGGIRSATFNLGVLQGLAQVGLLRHFDYLSTVSGGGYIGSWLVSWIHRRGFDEVERKLSVHNYRGPEIQHLRDYSNYLTPKRGLFGADAWAVISTYTRNLLLNLLILVAFLLGALLLPYPLEELFGAPWGSVGPWRTDLFLFTAVLAATALAMAASRALRREKTTRLLERPRYVLLAVVVPMLVAGFCFSHFLWHRRAFLAEKSGGEALLILTELGGLSVLAFVALVFFNSIPLVDANGSVGPRWLRLRLRSRRASTTDLLMGLLLSWIPGVTAAVLYLALARWMNRWDLERADSWAFIGAPFFAGLILLTTAVMMLGIGGRISNEKTREWSSRAGGSISLWATLISLGALVSLMSPEIADLVWTSVRDESSPVGKWVAGVLGSGWIGSTLAAVLIGKDDATPRSQSKRVLLAVAPYVFIVGLLVSLSVAGLWLQGQLRQGFAGVLFDGDLDGRGLGATVLAEALPAASLLLAGVLLSLMVDPNVFSMNAMYRNRLMRCYLGATNPRRRDEDFDRYTGFDHSDDVALERLRISKVRDRDPEHPDVEGPVRPMWICNAALNVVSGEELALQTRKAYNFAWTPWCVGYDPNPVTPWTEKSESSPEHQSRYVATDEYAGGMTVGEVTALSGAAVSPNMGYRTSPALNFLLTVFNVRLGGWYPNTNPGAPIGRGGPFFAAIPLVSELLGLAHAEREFVYLSDGGHFENLGLYELVRRGCQYIVVSDAGHDRDRTCPSLGNAIEKCRADFGVDIEIDTSTLLPDPDTGTSDWHCAIGRIRYDRLNPRAKVGTLVYLKTSVTGDEPADVRAYADTNPDFPHQTTADQWFDENQFESYRALGEHVVESVFAESAERARREAKRGSFSMEELAVRLRRRWFPPCPATASHFTSLSRRLDGLFGDLRGNRDLAFLDAQIIPEWPDLLRDSGLDPEVRYGLPDDHGSLRQGFYLCNQMIQLMEDVYVDLELEAHWSHPDNRGWMNLFRHWSWSSMFRAAWAVSASSYGARFQAFCQRHLDLGFGEMSAAPVGTDSRDTLHAVLRSGGERLELNFAERDIAREYLRHPSLESDDEAVHEVTSLRVRIADPMPAEPDDNGSGRRSLITFRVGFAILRTERPAKLAEASPGESAGGVAAESAGPPRRLLVYLRIQDHLRGMGFARDAIETLLADAPIDDVATDDPWVVGRVGVGGMARFRSLFLSVRRTMSHRSADAR